MCQTTFKTHNGYKSIITIAGKPVAQAISKNRTTAMQRSLYRFTKQYGEIL